MKITRDPQFEHVGKGGSFTPNMNLCLVWFNGKRQDIVDVISADDETGALELLERDSDGFPLLKSSTEPSIISKTGSITLQWYEESCSECAETERLKRQSIDWWNR